jgi:opacity protein-like surface antigen
MKKLFLLSICITAFASTSFSQKGYPGEKGVSSVGIMAGYAVDNKSFAVGLDFRHNVLARLRLSPSIFHVLKSDSLGVSTWYVNIDAHYLARVSNTTTIYPIVGAGLSIWTYELPAGLESLIDLEDIRTSGKENDTVSKIQMGLNLGVGLEKRVTSDIIFGIEFKYNLTAERIYSQAMLLGRIAYYF